MSFKNSWRTSLICVSMSYAIILFLRNLIGRVILNLLFDDAVWNLTGNGTTDFLIFFAALILVMMLIHETIHMAAFKVFRGKVVFRLKGLLPYAQEVSEKAFNRTQFLIILLAPVVIISSACLVITSWLSSMILILNLFISTADVLKALYLCRANYDSDIIHRSYGFDIVSTKTEETVDTNSDEVKA